MHLNYMFRVNKLKDKLRTYLYNKKKYNNKINRAFSKRLSYGKVYYYIIQKLQIIYTD